MKKDNRTIVLTGGHAVTTAVAVVEEIMDRGNYDIHWIGARSAVEGKRLEGIESIVFPELGVKLHSITTGRIQKRFTRYTIPALVKIPIGIIQAFLLLNRIKPKVIVSFGGFAAFPVVLSGFVKGIPIVLHEQTIAVGLANKLSSRLATKIAIARESSRKYFDRNKTVLTGNPIIKSIRSLPKKLKKGIPPVILITCGSRGSEIINEALLTVLPKLVESYRIIHLTGKLDFERFNQLNLKNYTPIASVNPLKIADIYKQSDIVIARAGANTVSEIMILGRPSILIPIPWTRYNEQQKNAESLVESGIGIIIHQDRIEKVDLLEEIDKVSKNWEKIVAKANPLYSRLDAGAAKLLSDMILTYI